MPLMTSQHSTAAPTTNVEMSTLPTSPKTSQNLWESELGERDYLVDWASPASKIRRGVQERARSALRTKNCISKAREVWFAPSPARAFCETRVRARQRLRLRGFVVGVCAIGLADTRRRGTHRRGTRRRGRHGGGRQGGGQSGRRLR